MAAQRLQKGDTYAKKLVRFTPEACALIQERADISHLSFNAALMEFIRTATPPEEWRALERKVRTPRRQQGDTRSLPPQRPRRATSASF